MENTLQVNDKIVALRVIDFHRGDIVVFQDDNGWLGAQPPIVILEDDDVTAVEVDHAERDDLVVHLERVLHGA